MACYIVKQVDASGNIVSENTGSSEIVIFDYTFFTTSKEKVTVPGGVHQAGYSCAGCYALTFIPQLIGSFELHLSVKGQQIKNMPATFKVNAGQLGSFLTTAFKMYTSCTLRWLVFFLFHLA